VTLTLQQQLVSSILLKYDLTPLFPNLISVRKNLENLFVFLHNNCKDNYNNNYIYTYDMVLFIISTWCSLSL